MPDEKFTRCPSCRTVFRVTAEQLAMRGGQVRCGHCRTLFDGVDHLVALAPPAFDDEDAVVDETDLGPPTVTLRDFQPPEPPPSATSEALAAAIAEVPIQPMGSVTPAAPMSSLPEFDVQEPPRRSGAATVLYAIGALVLLVALTIQAIYHFRDSLVAHWPASRPTLTRMCALAGCAVRPPREIADLAIQTSDLQADPAHRGLLTLTATLRNRGALALAYPYLELTLTDAQDQAVVRRALSPGDYAGGTADLAAGIPPNAEVPVKVFIDASATTQAGYRLYLFYP